MQLCVTYVSRSLLNWQNSYNSSDYPQIQRDLPVHGRTDLVEIAIVNLHLTGNSLAFTYWSNRNNLYDDLHLFLKEDVFPSLEWAQEMTEKYRKLAKRWCKSKRKICCWGTGGVAKTKIPRKWVSYSFMENVIRDFDLKGRELGKRCVPMIPFFRDSVRHPSFSWQRNW